MAFPASVITTDSNIQHIQNVIFYQRKAIDNLKANLATYPCMNRQPIPMKNGKTMRFYVNSLMAANVTPVSEGTPGAPIPHAGSVANSVTLQQYADYMTFSDWVVETAISPIVTEQAVELGYRAARSVDVLNYTQFDAAAAADSVARIDLADSSTTAEYFSASVARRARASLEARDVMPKEGGLFAGIMHPLVSYDYANDNTAGGVLDILKYNDFAQIRKGVFPTQDAPFTLDGIRWIRSTQVPTTANYGGGGQTAYHSYVIGKDAFFATSLSFSEVPNERNFDPKIRRYNGEQLVDPAGLIVASASYNFKYATYVPPDSISRFRRIRSEVSIT